MRATSVVICSINAHHIDLSLEFTWLRWDTVKLCRHTQHFHRGRHIEIFNNKFDENALSFCIILSSNQRTEASLPPSLNRKSHYSSNAVNWPLARPSPGHSRGFIHPRTPPPLPSNGQPTEPRCKNMRAFPKNQQSSIHPQGPNLDFFKD
ncbi:hypothetical protein BDV10DRAFT_175711 [Aspergillus recurvatus]